MNDLDTTGSTAALIPYVPRNILGSRAIGAFRKLVGAAHATDPSDALRQREEQASLRHQLDEMKAAGGIPQRAATRWSEDETNRQANREAIASQTEELLGSAGNVGSDDAQPELDPDWLNVFASFAEKASGDSLREMWARVLAGEIRKPGAISLRTLQFASTLDKYTASAVQAMASWILNGNLLPHVAAKHLPFSTMHLLHDEGLIGSMDSDISSTVSFDGSWWGAQFGERAVFVRGDAGTSLKIPSISVSRVAKELLATISLARDPTVPNTFVEWLKEQPSVKELRCGRCIAGANGSLNLPKPDLIWVRPA